MFKPDDRYQAFIDVAEAREACAPALVWCRALGDITFAQGLAEMRAAPDFKVGWAHWAWEKLADVIDAPAREVFFSIILKEPQASSIVYLEEPGLTDEQDRRLWAAFAGALPAMRRGIEGGKFTRAKEGRTWPPPGSH